MIEYQHHDYCFLVNKFFAPFSVIELLFAGNLFILIEHQPHGYCFLVNKLFHPFSVIEYQSHDYLGCLV